MRRDWNLLITIAAVAALVLTSIILAVNAWLQPEPEPIQLRWEVDGTHAGSCVVVGAVIECSREVTTPTTTEPVPFKEKPDE